MMTASERAAAIRGHLADAWDLLTEAYQAADWVELGYADWGDYLTAEFPVRPQLGRADRPEVFRQMADAGMSQREIAATTGVGKGTVSRSTTGPDGPEDDHAKAKRRPKPAAPTPEDLAGMDREDLRGLVSDAVAEAGRRLELEAIANGGTITPVGKPEPAPLPEPIATIAEHDRAWLAVVRAQGKMTAALDQFAAEWAPFPDGGEVQRRIQEWALDLLNYCDARVTT